MIIGYGDYRDCRLTEVPLDFLQQLAVRYPLSVDEDTCPDYEDLIITLAVHAEIRRREAGGLQVQRMPTLREMAQEIIERGYRQASKQYHPDRKGKHEEQVRLTQARDEILRACERIADPAEHEDRIVINEPGVSAVRVGRRQDKIDDDDVPF